MRFGWVDDGGGSCRSLLFLFERKEGHGSGGGRREEKGMNDYVLTGTVVRGQGFENSDDCVGGIGARGGLCMRAISV